MGPRLRPCLSHRNNGASLHAVGRSELRPAAEAGEARSAGDLKPLYGHDYLPNVDNAENVSR